MNLRDSVKQTATATSDTVYTFTSGTAEDGYRTFLEAFPTALTLAGTYSWSRIPLRVDTADGRWQIVIGTVTITTTMPVAEVIATGAAFSAGVVMSSSDGQGVGLGLAASTAVTVSLVDSVETFGLMTMATPDVNDADDGEGAAILTRSRVDNGGLLAIGANARAIGKGGVTIGEDTNNPYRHAYAFGPSMQSWRDGEHVYGVGAGALGGGVTQLIGIARGVMGLKTTDATPANLKLYDKDGLLTAAEWMYCFAGLTDVKGVVSCVNTTNGDTAVWDISFAVATHPVDWTSALFGTATITPRAANDAALSTADVDVAVDSVDNSVTIQATGVAATTLVWGFTYDAHHNEVNV